MNDDFWLGDRFWLGLSATLIAIVVIAAVLFLITPAYPHDAEHPELDEWYGQLKSQSGSYCCDGSEATHLADVDWDVKNGHYRVRLGGKWIDVPDTAVITDPNRDGRPLVWAYPWYPFGGTEATPVVRCFLPGSGT